MSYRSGVHHTLGSCVQAKARPSTPSVSRQFIISKGVFEFGPLLIGKDPTGYDTGAHPANTAKFRITNNG
jgi:hydrocephalus-inducing protein